MMTTKNQSADKEELAKFAQEITPQAGLIGKLEPLLNIHQRILAVMAELSYVQKGDKKVNNQYTFVSHDSVSTALHPLLVKHGITMLPSVTNWEHEIFQTSKGTPAFLVKVEMEVRFTNADDPNDLVSVKSIAFGIDPGDKATGKALSGAAKYAMLKTFVLASGDDPEQDHIDYVAPIPMEVTALISAARAFIKSEDWLGCCQIDVAGNDHWMAAWSELGSKERASFKTIKKVAKEYQTGLDSCSKRDDPDGFGQLDDDLDLNQARYLRDFGGLSPKSVVMMTKRRTA